MRRVMKGLGAANKVLARIGVVLAAALLAAMVLTVLIQIGLRSTTGRSLGWVEEVSKTMMVWSAFLSAPAAFRSRANLAVSLLVEFIPPNLSGAVRIIIDGAILWLFFILFTNSFSVVENGLNIRASSVPAPVGVFYSVLPASLFVLILLSIERLLASFSGFGEKQSG